MFYNKLRDFMRKYGVEPSPKTLGISKATYDRVTKKPNKAEMNVYMFAAIVSGKQFEEGDFKKLFLGLSDDEYREICDMFAVKINLIGNSFTVVESETPLMVLSNDKLKRGVHPIYFGSIIAIAIAYILDGFSSESECLHFFDILYSRFRRDQVAFYRSLVDSLSIFYKKGDEAHSCDEVDVKERAKATVVDPDNPLACFLVESSEAEKRELLYSSALLRVIEHMKLPLAYITTDINTFRPCYKLYFDVYEPEGSEAVDAIVKIFFGVDGKLLVTDTGARRMSQYIKFIVGKDDLRYAEPLMEYVIRRYLDYGDSYAAVILGDDTITTRFFVKEYYDKLPPKEQKKCAAKLAFLAS